LHTANLFAILKTFKQRTKRSPAVKAISISITVAAIALIALIPVFVVVVRGLAQVKGLLG
jgi:hypothetical protein